VAAELRLGISALGRRAYVGRLNKAKTCFLDGKQDVTSDFFKAVIDYFDGHEVVIEGDSGRRWTVRCQLIPTESPRVADYFDIFPADGCADCPWTHGDIRERDCGYPDCTPRWMPPC
jgi:hypothetical protein